MQSMLQLKTAYSLGHFKGMTARVLRDEDVKGYILDIAAKDLSMSDNIITAVSVRNPSQIKSFKTIDAASRYLAQIGFTECVVHIN